MLLIKWFGGNTKLKKLDIEGKMQISRKNMIGILVLLSEIFPIIALVLMPDGNAIRDTMSQIGIVAMICFVVTAVVLYKTNLELNAFFYFIVFAYLFSFGQSIMAVFGLELRDSAFALSRGFFTDIAIKNSAVFVLISIIFTCIGFLIYKPKKTIHSQKTAEVGEYVLKQEKARQIGWIMFGIGILPTFVNLYREYQTLRTLGYSFTLNATTGTARIMTLLSGFFISGILLLFCYERKHRNLLYMIVGAYMILQVAGGTRIQVFRLGILFLMIEDLYFKKMDKQKWMLVLIIGLITMFGFSLLSSIRNYVYLASDVKQLISTSFRNLWENNFIAASINEMGNTQVINTLVFDKCPDPIPFQFGLSFLKMIWAIFPNFIGSAYTGYIGVDITFSPLYTVTKSGMGASYISEGYWNFGYFSIIYFMLFGALFGKLVDLFNRMCKQKSIDPSKFFLVVYVIYYALFLVRSESLGFGRSFVYYALIPYILINSRGGVQEVEQDSDSSVFSYITTKKAVII